MLNVNFLPRCLAVAEVGYDGEEEVWKPCCQDRREIGLDGEGGGNRLEHDVAETQRKTNAQCSSHAALALAG